MSRVDQPGQIKVYTSQECSFCHLVKSYLQTKGVQFEEIDVGEDPDAGRELAARTGLAALPVTFFDDEVFVLGFDRTQLDSCLQDYGWL